MYTERERERVREYFDRESGLCNKDK